MSRQNEIDEKYKVLGAAVNRLNLMNKEGTLEDIKAAKESIKEIQQTLIAMGQDPEKVKREGMTARELLDYDEKTKKGGKSRKSKKQTRKSRKSRKTTKKSRKSTKRNRNFNIMPAY